MDLRKKALLPFFLLGLILHIRAEAEAEPNAEPEPQYISQPPPQWGTPGMDNQMQPPPMGGLPMGRPDYQPDYPINPVGPGGLPPLQPGRPDYQPDYPINPVGPGGLPPRPDYQPDYPINPVGPGGLPPIQPDYPINPVGPGGLPPRPDYQPDYPINPVGPGGLPPQPDYPINPVGPGGLPPQFNGNACQMQDQCCGFQEQDCCQDEQKKCYPYWKMECDGDAWCGTREHVACIPVVIPKCRVKTKYDRITLQTKRCVKKTKRNHCFTYEKQKCKVQTKVETKEISYETQQLKNVRDTKKTYNYNVEVNECVQKTGEDVITKVINKPIKYKVNIPVCRYETVPGEPYTYTVNKPKIEYRKMCYDVPQPKCSQTPCQNTGVCPPQTNACANDQTQTNTVCPLSGGIPGGSSGCQNVKQPVCYNGNACAPNYQTCCRMENKRVCVNRPIRVPNYEKVTVPGQPTYKRVCDNKEVERVRYEQETVTERNPTTSNRCERKTIPKTHEYTKKEFEVESKTDKGTVDIQVQECNIETEQDQFCVDIPDAEAECIPETITKNIIINYQECDGEEQANNCFTEPVPDCKEQNQCRWVQKQRCVNVCNKSNYCNICTNFIQQVGFGNCPDSTCKNYYGSEWTGGTSRPNYGGSNIGGSTVSNGGGKVGVVEEIPFDVLN